MTHANFPYQLYLVHHLPTNSYGSVFVDDERGLACFSHAAAARAFARKMQTRQNLIVDMTMADACEVAAGADLVSLILVDDLKSPLIHQLQSNKSHY